MRAPHSTRLPALALVAGLLALAGASAHDATARGAEGPANNGKPTVTGSAIEGQTVTGHNGSWWCNPGYKDPQTGDQWPTCRFDFQWQRCAADSTGCVDIAQAAGQNYVVGSPDRGSRLRVAVTATNYDCNALNQNCRYVSATAYSDVTNVVPGALPPPPPPPDEPPSVNAPPTIAGLPQEGQTVSASAGDWSGAEPIDYAFQWSRCAGSKCSPVSGEVDTDYEVTATDVGRTLTVTVTATNDAGSAAAASAPTDLVVAQPSVAPFLMSEPAVYGPAKEGATLTASTGAWGGSPKPTYSYGWLRCSRGSVCLPIEGADASEYVATAADGGRSLVAVVTATNRAGRKSASSPPTAVVEPRGLVHLQSGLDSVPAAGVRAPDRLRIDRVRLRLEGGRLVGTIRVADTRGFVVRGAIVTIRGAKRGDVVGARATRTSLEGLSSARVTVSGSKLRVGGRLVLVVGATRTDAGAGSVADRAVVRYVLSRKR